MQVKSPKELAQLRKQRNQEFAQFLKNPSLINVLNKLVAFLTDESSQKLTLRVTAGADSYTDGKTITLGLPDDFFDERYGEADWTAIFKILLMHEVQHINSSNFKDIEVIGDFYAAIMQQYGFPDEFAQQLARDFLNIMEDSRIENIYCSKLPGFKLGTKLLNNEIRLHTAPEKVAKKPFDEFRDFRNNALSYALTGRLAPNMSIYAGSRLESEFIAVADLFDAAVEARTSDECRQICEKMLTMTAPYFGELLKEEAAQAKAQKILQQMAEYTTNTGTEENVGSGSGSNSGNSSSGLRVKRKAKQPQPEKQGNQSGKTKNPADAEEKSNQNNSTAGKSDSGKDNQNSKSGNQSGNSSNDGDAANSQGCSESNNADAQDGANSGENEAVSSISGDGNSNNGSTVGAKELSSDEINLIDRSKGWVSSFDEMEEDNALSIISEEELAQIRRGIRDEIESANVTPIPVTDRAAAEIKAIYGNRYEFQETFPNLVMQEVPSDLLIQAQRLEREIEPIMHHKCAERRNTRTGRLDNRNLYRYGMHDPHLFMRKGQPLKADMAVVVLMDNSASMSECGAQMQGKKYKKFHLARTAAAIIELALSRFAAIKVTLFNSRGLVNHQTLKKFDERGKSNRDSRCYSSISQVEPRGCNRDGFSIRMAVKDLLARREKMKVLVILSDGLPSDYKGGETAGMSDVRDAVREARRKGVLIVPIMYGDAAFRRQSQEHFAYMYERFISCDPIDVVDQFKKLFIQLIKKA